MKIVSADQQKNALLQKKPSAEDWKRGWKEREMTTERKDQERSRQRSVDRLDWKEGPDRDICHLGDMRIMPSTVQVPP